MKAIHPILVTYVFGFYMDMLIRFWGQKSKVKVTVQAITRKPGEYNIFVNILANFTNIWSRTYLGLGHTD